MSRRQKDIPAPPLTPPGAPAPSRAFPWTALVCLLFLARTLPWLLGDLWYDEVLSLQLFLLPKDSLWEILRDYRIANNHFLANCLQWLWLKALPAAAGSEPLFRIPPLLCGVATLLIVARLWRRWLGERLALCAGFLLAASPVFAAFAIYARGYSLAMLLSTLGITALLLRRERPTAPNAAGLLLCCLALPLVMPSAAVAPMAFCLTLALLPKAQGLPWKRHALQLFRSLWPALLGAFLGCAYYLSLWEEFQKARGESGGWPSGWLVAGHLLLALFCHLSPALGVAFLPRKHPVGDARRTTSSRALSRALALGALLSTAIVLMAPAAKGHAPFPRVFLPLLPVATFAAALRFRDTALEEFLTRRLPVALACAALPGLLLGAAWDLATRRELSREHIPQNLLQQYYRGDQGCRLWVQRIAQAAEEGHPLPLVAVNATDAPAFLLYWQMEGLPAAGADGLPLTFPGNHPLPGLHAALQKGHPLVFLAHGPKELRQLLQAQGLPPDPPCAPVDTLECRTLYRIGK